MNIDLSTIPLTTVIALLVTVVVLVIILIKAMRSLHITKIGSIEIDYSGQAANALTVKKLEDIDSQLKDDVSDMTRNMSKQFLDDRQRQLCFFARRAISVSILATLQERTASNHFTTRLKPDRVKQYKATIMMSIEDYYKEMLIGDSARCPTNKDSSMEDWEYVKSFYSLIVSEWIVRVARLVLNACQDKISVYENALKEVKKSNYWYNVFNECKNKNEVYVQNMERILNA